MKKKQKKREMDCQLVASYFTVKSTDIFLQCTISVVLRGCQLVTGKREIILSSIFVIMDLSNEQGKVNGRCLRVRNRLQPNSKIEGFESSCILAQS